MTYQPQKGRGYGHVTFKISPFAVMQAALQRVTRDRQRQLSDLFMLRSLLLLHAF